jgi:hypothetical protein
MAQRKRGTVMTKINRSFTAVQKFSQGLRQDSSGLALVEFAVSLPFFLGIAISGVEVANYAANTMQVNQIALHVADNAARMGTNNLVGAKRVEEIDINDVFTGARHEGRGLLFDGFHPYTDPGTNQTIARGNARIFLSSVEPMANPNPTNKFQIRWQRCSGPGTHYRPLYGSKANGQNRDGIGPPGQQVTAPPNGAIMFAEVHYHFTPMLDLGFSNLVEKDIVATSAMIVRDSRDLVGPVDGEGVYPTAGVTASTCNF